MEVKQAPIVKTERFPPSSLLTNNQQVGELSEFTENYFISTLNEVSLEEMEALMQKIDLDLNKPAEGQAKGLESIDSQTQEVDKAFEAQRKRHYQIVYNAIAYYSRGEDLGKNLGQALREKLSQESQTVLERIISKMKKTNELHKQQSNSNQDSNVIFIGNFDIPR